MIYLLDANVLIALSDVEHAHHHKAVAWFSRQTHFATCPIVEGALVRYLVRSGAAISAIRAALTCLAAHPGHEFWADDLPYAETDLAQVIGHRQVTDAYLVSLARRHGNNARLATLDEGLPGLYPDAVAMI